VESQIGLLLGNGVERRTDGSFRLFSTARILLQRWRVRTGTTADAEHLRSPLRERQIQVAGGCVVVAALVSGPNGVVR
jgi:hypothetical protein